MILKNKVFNIMCIIMRIKGIIPAVCMLMTGVSCNVNDPELAADQPIGVQAGVVSTRAGYSGTDVLPEKFVMDIDQDGADRYDYLNVLMVRETGSAKYKPSAGTELLWAGDGRNVPQVKAMTVPYGLTSVDASGPMEIKVALDQSTASGVLESDVLVASSNDGDVNVSVNDVNIRFRHLLSKLEISYGLANGLTASDVTFNSVTLNGICVSGGYSYADMSFDSAVEPGYGDVNMYNDASSGVFEGIFFPYLPSTSPKLVIDMTVSGDRRILTCDVTPLSAYGFESGKKYTMSLSVSSNSINPSAIGISSGWDQGADAGSGNGSNEESFETE